MTFISNSPATSDPPFMSNFPVRSTKLPYVTVSSKGMSNGLSDIPNDGADFGPDTMQGATSKGQYGPPYSTTSGIWEANAYAYLLASDINEVRVVKVSNGTYNLNVPPVFPSISGINGSFAGGSGVIPVYPNVAIDFQGSVINLNYTGTGFLLLEINRNSVYLGYIENAIINVLNNTSNPLPSVIVTTSGVLNSMVRNVVINGQFSNGNFNLTTGILQKGSYVTLENINVNQALNGIEYTTAGATGTFVYNYYYNSSAQAYGNAHYINNYGDTIYIIGGRTVLANNEILINASTSHLIGLHLYDRDIDGIENLIYGHNSNGYEIRNVFISGCWVSAPNSIMQLTVTDANASDSLSNLYITGNRFSASSQNGFYIYENLLYGDFIFSNNSILVQNATSSQYMFNIHSPNPPGADFNFQIIDNSLQLASYPYSSTPNNPNLLYFTSNLPVIFKNNFIYNSTTVTPINISVPNTSIIENNTGLDSLNSTTTGTTAGTVTMNNTNYSPSYKKYIISLSGYENDTATNQTISYPLPFNTSAVISANNTGLTISTTPTGITITAPNSTTTYSGIVVVEGY